MNVYYIVAVVSIDREIGRIRDIEGIAQLSLTFTQILIIVFEFLNHSVLVFFEKAFIQHLINKRVDYIVLFIYHRLFLQSGLDLLQCLRQIGLVVTALKTGGRLGDEVQERVFYELVKYFGVSGESEVREEEASDPIGLLILL